MSDRAQQADNDPPRKGGFGQIGQRVPKLLVSVRCRQEADGALAGGADILDVKEPSAGSLGMAALADIAAIATIPSICSRQVSLSVALGEVADWTSTKTIPTLPPQITFAKLGLSQLASRPDWRQDWMRVRAEFELNSLSAFQWVAVAYADFQDAESPSIAEILAAAIETKCAGLLIDTWTKDGRRLLDEIGIDQLGQVATHCHQFGLFFAIAGRLHREQLGVLTEIGPDIIAIRSAACRNANRTLQLDAGCVAEFRQAMLQSMQLS